MISPVKNSSPERGMASTHYPWPRHESFINFMSGIADDLVIYDYAKKDSINNTFLKNIKKIVILLPLKLLEIMLKNYWKSIWRTCL